MNIKALVLVLFLPLFLTAQSLVELYQNYIPETVLQNKENYKETEQKLRSLGALDPDLLLFYLLHLTLRFEQNIKEPEKNFGLLLDAKVSKAKQLKKDWARYSIYNMQELYDNSVSSQKIASYYRQYKLIRIRFKYSGAEQAVDQNLQNYFKYLYITRKFEVYDSLKDYNEYFTQSLNSAIKYYTEIYNNIDKYDSEKTENIIQKAFDVSYIFKDSYIRALPQYTSFYLYELIHKLINQEYANYSKFYFEIPMELVPITRTTSFEFTDPMHFFDQYYYDLTIHNSLFLNFGYYLKLREEINPGSYLRFSVGAAFYQNLHNTFKDSLLFRGDRETVGLHFYGDYTIDNIRNQRTTAITSQFAFPILYFNNKLLVEAEFTYVFQNMKFDFDFKKPGLVIQPLPSFQDYLPFFEDQTIKVSKKYHSLYFGLSLNYSIIDDYMFRMEYLFPLSLRAGISYNYNLY